MKSQTQIESHLNRMIQNRDNVTSEIKELEEKMFIGSEFKIKGLIKKRDLYTAKIDTLKFILKD